MKIISWNVNSVRARLDNIIKYIDTNNPDILLLQEIKTIEENFPKSIFEDKGFKCYVNGQKSYNGVALLAKKKIDNFDKDFIKDKKKQARIIKVDLNYNKKKIKLINIYVPNGNPIDTEKYLYKKEWLDLLIKEIASEIKKKTEIILAGDFNIIPEEKDVYDSSKFENDALFRLEIRKKYRELINLGLNDVFRYFNKDKQEYTFWDYMAGAWYKNRGMRIDHFLVTNNVTKMIKSIKINKAPRGEEKPSDHTPIEISFT